MGKPIKQTTWSKKSQKRHREMWLEALRSRKYKQAKGTLREVEANGRESFCCLGVACEISGLGEWKGGSYVITLPDGTRHVNHGNLSRIMKEWLGLRGSKGSFLDNDKFMSTLVRLNDSDEKKFYEIARVIEREPEGLFT
jgi:hypothetical protein